MHPNDFEKKYFSFEISKKKFKKYLVVYFFSILSQFQYPIK